jgi:hypothetical protein
MNFDSPPEDLDYSVALEPMRLEVIGEQRAALSELLNELVATHPAKVKVKERDHLRSTYRLILLNVIHNSICTRPFREQQVTSQRAPIGKGVA